MCVKVIASPRWDVFWDTVYSLTPKILRWLCLYVCILCKSTRIIQQKAVLSQGTTARCTAFVQKLAPNPLATQWIKTYTKLLANMGKLSKTHFTSASVKDWCILPYCRMVSWNHRSRNSGDMFQLVRPQRCQISPRSDKSCVRYLLSNIFDLWKSRPKFTKLGEEVSIGQTLNTARFRLDPTKSVRDIRCEKIAPGKVGQSSS